MDLDLDTPDRVSLGPNHIWREYSPLTYNQWFGSDAPLKELSEPIFEDMEFRGHLSSKLE